jgi:ABC-type glutathione transport system ATPase component
MVASLRADQTCLMAWLALADRAGPGNVVNMTSVRAAPAVELDRVSVEPRGRAVLDGVSFRLDPGAVVGLIGPSGCGKTTLMRTLGGCRLESGVR